MKPLKPSMRENKRYLLIKGKNLKKNVEEAIFEFSGVLGMSKTGLNWIEENKNSAILSINRESLNSIRASFVVFKENIKIEKVSGTLKTLRKKANQNV